MTSSQSGLRVQRIAAQAWPFMHAVCDEVAMLIEPQKDEGPATTITFPGSGAGRGGPRGETSTGKTQMPKGSSTGQLAGKKGM